MINNFPYRLEFHVARQARDYYAFEDPFFMYNGNVIFANFNAARRFAQKMNDRKDLARNPEQAVRAGQINAMGLIDEILHLVIEQFRQERNPQVMQQALAFVDEELDQKEIENTLRQFAQAFPLTPVYRGEISLEDYLAGQSQRPDGAWVPNRELLLEEILMLWLANQNPAYAPYLELFDDELLEKRTAYRAVIDALNDFFQAQPAYGPENQSLVDLLLSPARAAPNSLTAQLEFIRTRWNTVMSQFLMRLLSGVDFVKEEEKPVFGVGGGEGVPVQVVEFTGLEVEPEQFSADLDWMPNLVLLAKNSFVWLDQLSKKYQRPITRLDEIPDAELDIMARWGFKGLWLIGLWERSAASKTIKQLRGNPEAVASAYSLMDYGVAEDLGGDEAYQDLHDRAWKRGIRLASDMVPNHMGIDSKWVIEHPNWFVQLEYPPFPSYSFNGPNLSWDERVGIYIEDHYYDNSDAAVVFKRVDFWTGSERYIYHGNDGTSMPWNDTAQLNYLLPELREAIIQTILHVARKFPVIRFDAAMTLAKRHYQRLWFPEPGKGGDIPSRAEFALTKEQFDEAFPLEFWREVVDRVAAEAPDTLLLAEAFWMMEGYFVRTLGMHRVYNSAFMNMLRDEKNQEYRQVIKNTLEFEPEILKRYVNFMNNPDEKTAVEQFGKGDKYFGIATMLATLPGLPMFGHGQVEGFTEKYGMEYRRAYWDEYPDEFLVKCHEQEIFPLLRKRYLFAEVKDFLLYDFYTPEGYVNEDVFAYSNLAGDEHSLILYHNKFASTRGWIRISTPYPVKTSDGQETMFFQKSLGDALSLHNEPGYFTIFHDQNRKLDFIRSSQELSSQGLYAELEAYQLHVLINFREVQDTPDGKYAQLADALKGQGASSIEEALQELFLAPLLTPYKELVNPGWYRWLIDNRSAQPAKEIETEEGEEPAGTGEPPEIMIDEQLVSILTEAESKALLFYQAVQEKTSQEATTILEPSSSLESTPETRSVQSPAGDPEGSAGLVRDRLGITLLLPAYLNKFASITQAGKSSAALAYLLNGPGETDGLQDGDPATWGTILSWLFNHRLSQAAQVEDSPEQSQDWIDEWLLGKYIAQAVEGLGVVHQAALWQLELIKTLVAWQDWFIPQDGKLSAARILHAWLKDNNVQRLIKVNRYQDILWYNKEAFEELLWWMYLIAVIQIIDYYNDDDAQAKAAQDILDCFKIIQRLQKAEALSDFQVERLLDAA